MYKNKIGLEVEFLVRKGKSLIFPKTIGLEYDDFSILGECRAEPGETRAETIGNFHKAWTNVQMAVKKAGAVIDLTGFATLSPEMYAEAMRRPETKKAVPTCKNVYGTDILIQSDAVVKDGLITGHLVSAGLHIHFSSADVKSFEYNTPEYREVSLPQAQLVPVFVKVGTSKLSETLSVNRVTSPVLFEIVHAMDRLYGKSYSLNTPLKYRVPGFYEVKSDGRFEYRSMPFTQKVLNDLTQIVDYAYTQLEAINLP